MNEPIEKNKTLELKEQALDSTVRRARFGRGSGPVARESTEWVIPASVLCKINILLLILAENWKVRNECGI